ncbi:SET domain-containing protein [Exidia glandulosa HHB12029]|uniref:SET domain-containing protein n=1 Tax=Exidia glandulosa HHB12029 TaxID=1314781 RepID=A0A166N015_EXIGL|nr:SET domain-containing protein [Exidia glandulosa HHB12029]
MDTVPALVKWLQEKGLKNSLVAVQDIPGKGRGLVVREDVQPGTSLFTLRDSALLNLRTLRLVYPRFFDGVKNKTGLNAIQLLALHLFLHRPKDNAPSTDEHWGPYITSLPTEFDTHPLVWRCREDDDARDQLSLLPLPHRRAVEAVWTRFQNDAEAVTGFLADARRRATLGLEESYRSLERHSDFLWAWLCINTRSIYYRVVASPKSADNLTLCPLLDFANHATVHNSGSSVPTFHAPTALRAGDEVFLNYGPHPDQTLFAEYGFVTGDEERQQLDVGPELEGLFQADPHGAMKRMLLEDANYWQDWTLHLTPTPHPSFRTMTALRLLCLPSTSDDDVKKWQDTVHGLENTVSEENESSVRRSLEDLCSRVLASAATNHQRAQDLVPVVLSNASSHFTRDTICALWKERQRVATAVLEATRRGDEF